MGRENTFWKRNLELRTARRMLRVLNSYTLLLQGKSNPIRDSFPFPVLPSNQGTSWKEKGMTS